MSYLPHDPIQKATLIAIRKINFKLTRPLLNSDIKLSLNVL